jgi:hypothetical protein
LRRIGYNGILIFRDNSVLQKYLSPGSVYNEQPFTHRAPPFLAKIFLSLYHLLSS